LALKRWFGGPATGDQDRDQLSTEDLIVLERYAEAEARLRDRLKGQPGNLHARLKLAEVYTASKQFDKAVEEYVCAAGEYAQDGFFDKGLALLARAMKLRPLDDGLQRKVEAFDRAKRLEHSRVAVLDGLRSGSESDAQRQRAAMELGRVWQNLATSPLVARLPDDQLRRLFSVMEMVQVEQGTILAEQGSQLAQLALVCRGVVEAVIPKAEGGDTLVRTFGAGDVIGDGALLEHRPWPATYRMAEAGALLTLDREGLERCLVGNPDPRSLLDALREQHNDREVAAALSRLRPSS
jgi:CRP-like cAMP-binding protein